MVLGYLFTYGYVLMILLIAAIAEKFKLLGQEGRRKLVHVLLIFAWIIMVRYFKTSIHMVIVPASFVLLNTISYWKAKKNDGSKVPILSSMERIGDEETPGTVYYALSIMIMGIIVLLNKQMVVPCGIGLFCMAFGDGMAGVIGKKVKGIFAKQIVRGKSLGGSIACVVFSVIGCELLFLCAGYDFHFWKLIVVGISCAILELPDYGLDNITVPFGCMLIAHFLLQ